MLEPEEADLGDKPVQLPVEVVDNPLRQGQGFGLSAEDERVGAAVHSHAEGD
jgi:hypothetical protein